MTFRELVKHNKGFLIGCAVVIAVVWALLVWATSTMP